MAREFKRTDRLGDAIQRILASLLQFEVRDPRIGMVNINDVVVARDLAHAKIFVTFVDRTQESECEAAAAALNKASGFLRSRLAKELDIRKTPALHFVYDQTSVRGQALSSLIDRAVKADQVNDQQGENDSSDSRDI